MKPFDIAPFALPNCPAGEYRFEEPRDIVGVAVTFRTRPPRRVEVFYLQRHWPRVRFELHRDTENPAGFGWFPADDQWNGAWRRAGVRQSVAGRRALVTFRPLREDSLGVDCAEYDVTFRRTVGVKVSVRDQEEVRAVEVFTRSAPARTTVSVSLDAGARTRGKSMRISAYNARVECLTPRQGVKPKGLELSLAARGRRVFEVTLSHMVPVHAYCGDDALLSLALPHDTFTIRLSDLDRHGPIWCAEHGVFVARAGAEVPFADYRARFRDARTVLSQVSGRTEQSFAGPFYGQPRPHAVNYSLGCALSPQRFWLEANGDLLLHRGNLDFLGRRPELARRMRTAGSARFFFGLERWIVCARYCDPAPVPGYTMLRRCGDLFVEQRSICVPLLRSILDGPLAYHEPTVALLRFRFNNAGDGPVLAELGIGYSQDSTRSQNAAMFNPDMDDYLVPRSPRDPVSLQDGRMTTPFEGVHVLRAAFETATMAPSISSRGDAALRQVLAPGASCEMLLKVPYVALEEKYELEALGRLDFDECHREVSRYWREENRRGSDLATPVPHLDTVHASHLSHVQLSDIAMPDDPLLVNTSVGSSTYGNFANESCMILQELDQRGLPGEVEKRLALFVRYAGTARQPGNFADFDGSFYGAGGWECGDYNQHHGWVLWYLAEHYLLTRNRAWFAKVADAVTAGADWVFRQRRLTMEKLPHSRGWEHGFLPAGSLEDVTEFHYWLSTNSLTWRGADRAARALEMFGHPHAGRVRAEADAFRRDIVRGLELSRQHAPLVPLRDGRWVPHYPSRLYSRGRDYGWIREVLEGAIYLPLSGLLDPRSKQAGWILDDYQDNLYHAPPYGYVMRDPGASIRHRGGFSIQPNLLAGLMPHLERDEIEVYLWMFFNAWAACFREDIGGMIEHPLPELGFSNSTGFKTSDEANAVMWLRAMMVHSTAECLHLGKAIPRAWFAHGEEVRVTGVRTHYGEVSAHWKSALDRPEISLDAELSGPQDAPRVLARFRHPQKAPIESVTVNSANWARFDPARGDVDISGLKGMVRIVARYDGSAHAQPISPHV